MKALLLLAPAALGLGLFGQDPFADVEIKREAVAGNVHVLFGHGGNIGVSAGPDGLLMVDDQFEPLADKIRAALKELGEGEPKMLINTHWHGDHTGGNAAFGAETLIMAHTNVRARLKTGGGRGAPAPAVALPVVTWDKSVSVHFNGEEIRVVHYRNAHTDGDSVLWFTGSNVVHMGDLFFEGRFPFVDGQSGGSVRGLLEVIDAVLAELPEGARIIPGHGEVTDRKGMETYRKMIADTLAAVEQRLEEGMDASAAANAGLPGYEDWSYDFITTERWIQTVYRELAAE